MQIAKMSTSARQHVLTNWIDMFKRAQTRREDYNGVLRQCAQSFPEFSTRMRTNLRSMRADAAFELAMHGVFNVPLVKSEFGAPVAVPRRPRRR